MAETSLSKLQKRVTEIEKDNAKLRDLLEDRKQKQRNAEKELEYYRKNLEKIVNAAVKKSNRRITDRSK